MGYKRPGRSLQRQKLSTLALLQSATVWRPQRVDPICRFLLKGEHQNIVHMITAQGPLPRPPKQSESSSLLALSLPVRPWRPKGSAAAAAARSAAPGERPPTNTNARESRCLSLSTSYIHVYMCRFGSAVSSSDETGKWTPSTGSKRALR